MMLPIVMKAFLKQFYLHIQEYTPKSIICLREGYSSKTFLNDLFAGISIGVITLPMALAFAIASGVAPERGLFTAIVAGFLISLLGGSRVQIGGPTGAFAVIVYAVVQKHGYDGLALATIIAGAMMLLMGIARFGVLLKFIPYPVTTGLTTGIALVLFVSQLRDFFGLQITKLPPEFLGKCSAYCLFAHTWQIVPTLLGLATLAALFFLRSRFPKLPGVIMTIIGATVLAYFFQMPLETIESKFGEIPRILPTPAFPDISFNKLQAVFPDAITIALLGAIESLLSAVVADGLTGYRHRSNAELVAQGMANISSILFGGIPATGAIARTAANVRLGAKTPVSGMIHAITLLLLMVAFAPFASKIPLCALSAVIIFVAWNMSELEHFIHILKGFRSDALVLTITFLLTVLIDLTVAVQIGVILSAMLFVKHISDATTVKVCANILKEDALSRYEHAEEILTRDDIPADIAIFEIKGPFFYSVSDLLNEALLRYGAQPRVFILRMQHVPLVDSTGIHALKQFALKCQRQNILFLLSGVGDNLEKRFLKTGLYSVIGRERVFSQLDEALSFVLSESPERKIKDQPISQFSSAHP